VLVQTTTTVLRRAQASFERSSTVTNQSFSAAAVAGGPAIEVEVPVHVLNWNPPHAWIDVTAVEGDVQNDPFSVLTPTLEQITDTPGIVRIGFDPTGLSAGLYSTTAEITWSEQPLPGAVTGTLFATLNVTVKPGEPTSPVGDLNNDGIVDFADLLILLAAWGPCPNPPEPCDADLDASGTVDFNDLLILLSNWG